MKCLTCHGLITNGNCGCSTGTRGAASVNIDTMLRDRDAEIARLKAEVARLTSDLVTQGECIDRLTVDLLTHKRALAAGPAALRAVALQARAAGETILADGALDCAANVEAAQAAAMKEGT